jgi:DNA-binding NtrC family response regulator
LYYRLQVMEITLPPLRAHKEDLPALVAHFIATLAPQLGLEPISVSDEQMAYLLQYDWPGNVRELRNLVERSLILGALNVQALYPGLEPAPGPIPAGGARADATAVAGTGSGAGAGAAATDLQTLEKRHILSVLESVGGDKTRAAALLGISRRTLERRCAEWQLGA